MGVNKVNLSGTDALKLLMREFEEITALTERRDMENTHVTQQPLKLFLMQNERFVQSGVGHKAYLQVTRHHRK